MKKKGFLLFLVLTAALLLSACGSRTVYEMYSPPRRSSEYNNLQKAIDTAMAGMDYAAPVSGENRQSVQTADLDGDGREEYLVFAKGNGEDPLRILIFRQTAEDRFELSETISSKGAAFEQVQYIQFDDMPGCEMIVGRQLNDQVMRIASVYSFVSGQSEQILSTIYAKFLTCNLDGDEKTELLVIRSEEANSDYATSVLYGWEEEKIQRSAEAMLSEKAGQIRRITLSTLENGQRAVYVSSLSGTNTVFTDILTLADGIYTNVAFHIELGNAVTSLHNYLIYAEDIDSDGVLELPRLIPMGYFSPSGIESKQNVIEWFSVNPDGTVQEKEHTFHNYADGWYVELRRDMVSRVAAEENGNILTFYMWNESYGQAMAVFSVYAFTGKDRDSQAALQNRFALHRGENVVYAGKLESASAIYGFTEEYLTNAFHLLRQDWKNGEI